MIETLVKPSTAVEAFDYIRNNTVADDSVRVVPQMEPGNYIPQGDVNLFVIDRLPTNAIPAKPQSQLAPGNSKGSRHCIRESCMQNVEFYKVDRTSNPLQGPILLFTGPVIIEHPEHGDQTWPAGTVMVVGYQRSYAEELKRQQD